MQESDIDIGKVVTYCPNLVLLKGFFRVFEVPPGKFIKLKIIELHMPNAETFSWFFANCPCLEEAKVSIIISS